MCATCGRWVGVCRCEGKCPVCGRYRVECGGCKRPEGARVEEDDSPRKRLERIIKNPGPPKVRAGKGRVGRDGYEYGDYCGECGVPEDKCVCWASNVNDVIRLYEELRKKRGKSKFAKMLRGMLVKRIMVLLERLNPEEREGIEFNPDFEDRMWRR